MGERSDGKLVDQKGRVIGTWDKQKVDSNHSGGAIGSNVTASDPTTHQMLSQIATLLSQINAKTGGSNKSGGMPGENSGANSAGRNGIVPRF